MFWLEHFTNANQACKRGGSSDDFICCPIAEQKSITMGNQNFHWHSRIPCDFLNGYFWLFITGGCSQELIYQAQPSPYSALDGVSRQQIIAKTIIVLKRDRRALKILNSIWIVIQFRLWRRTEFFNNLSLNWGDTIEVTDHGIVAWWTAGRGIQMRKPKWFGHYRNVWWVRNFVGWRKRVVGNKTF